MIYWINSKAPQMGWELRIRYEVKDGGFSFEKGELKVLNEHWKQLKTCFCTQFGDHTYASGNEAKK